MTVPNYCVFFFGPGGGEKRIESQKLEWKASSKVGSTDYIRHKPGGGNVKVRREEEAPERKTHFGAE